MRQGNEVGEVPVSRFIRSVVGAALASPQNRRPAVDGRSSLMGRLDAQIAPVLSADGKGRRVAAGEIDRLEARRTNRSDAHIRSKGTLQGGVLLRDRSGGGNASMRLPGNGAGKSPVVAGSDDDWAVLANSEREIKGHRGTGRFIQAAEAMAIIHERRLYRLVRPASW